MSLGRKRSRERRQRFGRWLWRLSQGLMLLIAILGFATFVYRGAEELARSEVSALETQVARLTQQEAEAQQDKSRINSALEQSRSEIRDLQARYARDVPRPPYTQLLTIAQERITAGVAPDRLANVLRQAENTRRCETRAVSRRFAIRFGGAPSADEGTSFLEGMLRITAALPASAEDVARLSTVTVANAWNGRTETLTGLPQRLSLPLGNLELDLNIASSDVRGFAQATLATCIRN